MSSYIIIITLIGFAALGMAWMPAVSKRTRVSYAILYILLGMLVYIAFGQILPLPDPLSENEMTVHLTELVVIISLMGTGLKIDTPFSFRRWSVPFRLVSITMLLSIFGVMAIGMYLLHLDAPSALLLGAALAPTDPVLASDVQVGPPGEEKQDNVKFSLTAEAGFNDGTAFPFTWLAVLMASTQIEGPELWTEWIWRDLLYRIGVGVVIGYLLGRVLAYLLFDLSKKKNMLSTQDGFVATSATLLIYGLTEILQGYGFFAVFVAAITLRNSELNHHYHHKLHESTDQVERALVAVVLILFGGSLVMGILRNLSWQMALFGLAFVFLIRPLTAYIGLIGTRLHRKEKFAISFFGIKGIGSFFYLAFGLSQVHFNDKESLWSIGAFVVIISAIVHGLTATPVMERIESQFARKVKVPK